MNDLCAYYVTMWLYLPVIIYYYLYVYMIFIIMSITGLILVNAIAVRSMCYN